MNPLIALQYQAPDLAGAFARGREQYQQGQEADRSNALAAYVQQNGAGIMSGDTNALAGLANLDPKTAMAIQAQQQGMANEKERLDLTRRSTEAGMANDASRLDLLRKQAAEQTAEHAAKMDAMERAATLSTLTQGLGAMKGAETPEAWDERAKMLGPDGEQLVGQFEHRDDLLAMGEGMLQGLGGGKLSDPAQALADRARLAGVQPGSPEYRDFMLNGGVDRTEQAPSGYRYNAAGNMEPIPGGPADPARQQNAGAATEGERKAAGFEQRMIGANERYEALPEEDQTINRLQDFAAGWLPESWVLSDGEQVSLQNQIDFTRAKLRFESGAVIGDDEAREEAAYLFPRPGDSKARIEEKAKSRAAALEQMRIAAGRSAQDQGAQPPPPPPAAPPAEILQQLQGAPAGTRIQGPGGEIFIWDGAQLQAGQ